ncbi:MULTISPECIES: hypothetical protein [Streptomyces]|uniref:Uncharacterized protein n=1 Tax=Streptomyces parvus TaxID=66428 RepID=A0A5D4JMT6_9ACTN|nr:hypothetical protein [Streptomyces parvus]TYR66166.1 hypothetical protein FY004_02340 [Streptomyces parvus]
MRHQDLFHGGVPGLGMGAPLFPPSKSQTTATTQRYALPTSAARDAGWVYLTPDPEIAAAYAAMYPDGALYIAEPLGPMEPDPMSPSPGVMWRCRAARVLVPVIECVTLKSQPHLIEMALEAFRTGDVSDTDRKIAAILDERPWMQPPGWDTALCTPHV